MSQPSHLIQPLHQEPDQPRENAGKNGQHNRSAPSVPTFELRHSEIIVNATRLEHYHQKKCYHEANDAPFQSPENDVEHLNIDCNRGVCGLKKSACERVAALNPSTSRFPVASPSAGRGY